MQHSKTKDRAISQAPKNYLFLLFTLLTFIVMPQAFAGNYYDRSHARNLIDVDVVNESGRRYNEYRAHSGSNKINRSYLEAKDGKAYGIKVRNNTAERIGVVIAVDGRNIISGRRSHLKSNERMYILNPYQRSVYKGWRSGKNRINEFYFTDTPDSYAERAFGDNSAMGVVAVAVFKEKNGRWSRYNEQHDEYEYRGDRRYRDHTFKRDRKAAPDSSPKSKSKQRSQSAPQTKGYRNDDSYSDEAGTGYGDDRYSPTRRVRFKAERRFAEKHLIKYEWTATLCEMGVKRCHRGKRNRLWGRNDNYQYAPPPPNSRSRHFGQGIH